MLYRDVPGWPGALAAAKYHRPKVPQRIWDQLGEIEAPASLLYLNGANEVFVVLWEHFKVLR